MSIYTYVAHFIKPYRDPVHLQTVRYCFIKYKYNIIIYVYCNNLNLACLLKENEDFLHVGLFNANIEPQMENKFEVFFFKQNKTTMTINYSDKMKSCTTEPSRNKKKQIINLINCKYLSKSHNPPTYPILHKNVLSFYLLCK